MDGSIRLTVQERKRLLWACRSGSDLRVSRRAHVILLRARGRTWKEIRDLLFCSNDLIAAALCTFRRAGVDGLLESRRQHEAVPAWLLWILQWLRTKTPQDFGYYRARWSCEILANLLAWERRSRLSSETVRRGLKRIGFVWRRPRPVVGPTDPEYSEKLRAIRQILNTLPANEVAVFQDEVDLHLNPKIGAMWMEKGKQAMVETPGNNRKCHLAGSLVWRTGTLLVSPPQPSRNAALFVAHLQDLQHRLRHWKRIHVICDNAKFHDCRAVRQFLKLKGHRIVLHFLPKYAPETNPIERVWWHLHETITRNHRCSSLEELIQQSYEWFAAHNNHFLDMRHTFARAA